MWFVGMMAGLFMGAMLESLPMAVLLALVGALVFQKLFGKKKKDEPQRTEAESALSDGRVASAPAAGREGGDARELADRKSVV